MLPCLPLGRGEGGSKTAVGSLQPPNQLPVMSARIWLVADRSLTLFTLIMCLISPLKSLPIISCFVPPAFFLAHKKPMHQGREGGLLSPSGSKCSPQECLCVKATPVWKDVVQNTHKAGKFIHNFYFFLFHLSLFLCSFVLLLFVLRQGLTM